MAGRVTVPPEARCVTQTFALRCVLYGNPGNTQGLAPSWLVTDGNGRDGTRGQDSHAESSVEGLGVAVGADWGGQSKWAVTVLSSVTVRVNDGSVEITLPSTVQLAKRWPGCGSASAVTVEPRS